MNHAYLYSSFSIILSHLESYLAVWQWLELASTENIGCHHKFPSPWANGIHQFILLSILWEVKPLLDPLICCSRSKPREQGISGFLGGGG